MNNKQILWLVITVIAVVVVINTVCLPEWAWLIVAVVVIVVYDLLETKKDKQQQTTNTPQNTNDSTQNLAMVQQKENDSEDTSKDIQSEKGDDKIPDLSMTKFIVWNAHCINLPFLPMDKNMVINAAMKSRLDDFEDTVKAGDQETTIAIYNEFQDAMRQKFGENIRETISFNPLVGESVFKIGALSKDLLDLFKMVIEGRRNESVLDGKGSIRRILKYSIELGSPDNTLKNLTLYFMRNEWFTTLPEKHEWMKLALECAMVNGNPIVGKEMLSQLKNENNITEDEIEELREHASFYRTKIETWWMK